MYLWTRTIQPRCLFVESLPKLYQSSLSSFYLTFLQPFTMKTELLLQLNLFFTPFYIKYQYYDTDFADVYFKKKCTRLWELSGCDYIVNRWFIICIGASVTHILVKWLTVLLYNPYSAIYDGSNPLFLRLEKIIFSFIIDNIFLEIGRHSNQTHFTREIDWNELKI